MLFSAFRKALQSFWMEDAMLLERRKKRAAISHRIAHYLEGEPFEGYMVDLFYQVKLKGRDVFPEIILHNRKDDIAMAIFWEEGYLTEEEQAEVRRFHEEAKPFLTLAFAFLPEKNYFLVYRFEEEYVEYLHISKGDFSEEVLKRCNLASPVWDNNEELLFRMPRKMKARKKKTTSSSPSDPTPEQYPQA